MTAMLRFPRVVTLLLAVAAVACQAKAPPTSPQAAAFKKEVTDLITKLTPLLGEPLARGDAQGVMEVILSHYPQAGQESGEFPFRLGVLDEVGLLVATLPPLRGQADDFSHYAIVKEVLKTKRWGKARLYAPDGSTLFVVAAPIMSQRRVEGLLLLRLAAAEAHKRWGLTEKEFLALSLD